MHAHSHLCYDENTLHLECVGLQRIVSHWVCALCELGSCNVLTVGSLESPFVIWTILFCFWNVEHTMCKKIMYDCIETHFFCTVHSTNHDGHHGIRSYRTFSAKWTVSITNKNSKVPTIRDTTGTHGVSVNGLEL